MAVHFCFSATTPLNKKMSGPWWWGWSRTCALLWVCVAPKRGGDTWGSMSKSFNLEYSSNTCRRFLKWWAFRTLVDVRLQQWGFSHRPVYGLCFHTHMYTCSADRRATGGSRSRLGRLMFTGLSSLCLFNISAHLSRNTFALSAQVWPSERGDSFTICLLCWRYLPLHIACSSSHLFFFLQTWNFNCGCSTSTALSFRSFTFFRVLLKGFYWSSIFTGAALDMLGQYGSGFIFKMGTKHPSKGIIPH